MIKRKLSKYLMLIGAMILVLAIVVPTVAAYEGHAVDIRVHVEGPPPTVVKYRSGPDVVHLGTYQEWTFTIDVFNPYDYTMQDAWVKDNFGGELQVKNITIGSDVWDFEYQYYCASNAEYRFQKNGGGFGGWYTLKNSSFPPIGFTAPFGLNWQGSTAKLQLDEWIIGNLAPGASASLVFTIYTDLNPGCNQEYTSLGSKLMNSGAVIKWWDSDGTQHSMDTPQISINVIP